MVDVEGPLFYANANSVKDRMLELVDGASTPPRAVVLQLAESPDLDVESLDMLADLARVLSARGIELRLTSVRAPVLELLRRSGVAEQVRVEPTVDEAVRR